MDDTIGSVPWHALRQEEIKGRLNTDLRSGITEEEARARLTRFGGNVFSRHERESYLEILTRQFKSPLVLILLIAGFATLALREYADSAVIFFVIVINAGIGLYQEGRAGKAFEKLARSQVRMAVVIRDGARRKIPAEELVPGDIVELMAGGVVPADVRLFSATELSLNESALTGEWLAVDKDTHTARSDARITDQSDMAFMGTLVASGTGRGVVVRTGERTEMGRIARSLELRAQSDTPFQTSIKHLARFLAIVITTAVIVIFAVGLLRGQSFHDMLLLSIAVAVAAIPSGLPIAVTVVLAIGLEHILARGGLIKNLIAAETLGSTTVILTDKTGTLTQADMRVAHIHSAVDSVADRAEMLEYAVLASDAYVERPSHGGELSEWRVEGRPVERAIVLAGLESGIDKEELLERYSCGEFRPFSSVRRFSTIVCSPHGKKQIAIMMGAPELLLALSKKAHQNGKPIRLTGAMRKELEQKHEASAAEGVRFVAVAYRFLPERVGLPADDELLADLVFGAYIGLHDPIRSDARESILTAQRAGARVIMVTGDHASTARRIAEEVGILNGTNAVITGDDFARMNPKDKRDLVKQVNVFARMLPDQKLELMQILKKQGEIVAMTGDGINDAPALQSANIGIALGSGTEVAKEASDLILLTNSFSIIVYAIEEGRRIIDNLKKIVAYLLSTAFGEIIVVGGALLLGAPIPILPVQILWTNIIEEGFMTVAFAFEPKESDIMRRNPRSADMHRVLTRNLKLLVTIISGITGLFLVALYFILLARGLQVEYIRTVMFAALSIDSIFYTFSLKNLRAPVWKIKVLSNPYLVFAFATSVLALGAALFLPPLRTLLHLEQIGLAGIAGVLAIGFFNLASIEGGKYALFQWYNKAV